MQFAWNKMGLGSTTTLYILKALVWNIPQVFRFVGNSINKGNENGPDWLGH